MSRKSYDIKSDINTLIEQYSLALAKENNLRQENRNKRIAIHNELMDKIYKHLSWENCKVIVKKHLPFLARHLYDIKIRGYGKTYEGDIEIGYTFKDSYSDKVFILKPNAEEIIRILKLKIEED